MNLGDVERELRAGPPEEDLYRVRALVLDDDRTTPAQRLAAPRLAPRAVGGLRLAAAIVGVVALVGAGVAVGRLTAASPTTQEPAAASAIHLQPAFVSDALRQAFYSGVDRQRVWLVCTATPVLTCTDASAYRTADPLNSDEWPYLKPVTLSSGHVIVGAQLDPVLPVAAYLSPATNPSAAGPALVPVTIYPGDTFLDLGPLSPGRYVLSVLISPTSPEMSGQTAIGIVVR